MAASHASRRSAQPAVVRAAIAGSSAAIPLNAAFFENTTSNGPSGLLSLSGINVVDTGTITLDSLDPFHEAKAAALADGAELSVFVLAPDVALTLSKAKQLDSGSNVGLLDATGVADGTTLAGVPVLVSTDVGAGNAWGLDSSQLLVVQRSGTQITRSTDAAFDYDVVLVRGTACISWGFSNPGSFSASDSEPNRRFRKRLPGV